MITVSARVAEFCRRTPERMAWLAALPHIVTELAERWELTLGERFDGEGEASWVAPVVRRDGTHAVLKLGMPHYEALHEADGLRFWDGDPTVRLLAADDALGALLLERCEPGTLLGELPEPEQDVVIAGLLPRMWRVPPAGHGFRPLAEMIERWIDEALAQAGKPDTAPDERTAREDAELMRAGVEEYRALLASAPPPVLLATDLHAGNVLLAARAPWLVIDPKPFMGDPAYDATQHLVNCPARMVADPHGTVRRFADLLGLDADRVRRWTFARLAPRVRRKHRPHPWNEVARALADR